MDVIFYVRAGVKTGWGHLFRCLALADELRTLGADCTFLTEPGAIERVARAGFEAFAFDANLSPFPGASVTIVDLEGGCPPDVARRVRQACD
ncbi:MAG: hypothetical protein KKF27_21615, partial [Gammaproteobacteria bacterium]|nr:hypothetical protein [Gammaproteobacteria bacterium]